MTELTPLMQIEKDLREAEFGTHLLPIAPDNLYEHLFIAFGRDDQGRDYFMHLFFVNDLLNAAGEADGEDDAVLLQFTLEYPFALKASSFNEVSRLLLALSPMLPIGALGLNEDRAQVYFNYVLALPNRQVDDVVIEEVVNIALFYTRAFAPLIEAVATGQRSRANVLEELQSKGLSMPATPQESTESSAATTEQPNINTMIRG